MKTSTRMYSISMVHGTSIFIGIYSAKKHALSCTRYSTTTHNTAHSVSVSYVTKSHLSAFSGRRRVCQGWAVFFIHYYKWHCRVISTFLASNGLWIICSSAYSNAQRLLDASSTRINVCPWCVNTCRRWLYVCMYGHHIEQSIDHPGKVANPAHGQLNREN